jgi:hypothetical protein
MPKPKVDWSAAIAAARAQDALETRFDRKLLGDCDLKPKALIARLAAGKSFAPT